MFPCTICGLCCQNISHISELKDFDLGNGVCQYYNEATSYCLIYENRPNICNIEKMFTLKYKESFSKHSFYTLNADACNLLQNKYKIDKKYKVVVE